MNRSNNFRMPRFSSARTFKPSFSSRRGIMGILVVIVIIVVIALMAIRPFTKTTVTATVTDKERITESSSDGGTTSKYLIFTDQETFECTDETIYLKFNSSDVYGQIKEGNTYKFTVVGWRIPLFSTYRNIIKVEKQ